MFYVLIKDNEVIDIDINPMVAKDCICREATEEEVEQFQQKKERERIGQLYLTRGDVFRGLLQAKGVTRLQLRGMIDLMPEETQEQKVQKELAYIDFDEALNFYRGVPLVDTLSSALGITSEQMTKFFETGDWHKLIELQQDKEE